MTGPSARRTTTIRAVRPGDHADWLRLRRALWPDGSADEHQRDVERFFRGDRSRRSSSGSGLGLSITRELVELNAGTIEARNGDGTVTFEITLPGNSADELAG